MNLRLSFKYSLYQQISTVSNQVNMGKSAAERQRERRKRVKELAQHLEKDKKRKAAERANTKKNSSAAEREAYVLKERVRLQMLRASNKSSVSSDYICQTPYRTPQAVGKAVSKVSVKEAHNLFCAGNTSFSIGLAKFSSLHPSNVKLFDQIPHNVCVCSYHENIRLLLDALHGYTSLANSFSDFGEQLTCNTESYDCIHRKCSVCADALGSFKPDNNELIKYAQWHLTPRAEKVELVLSVNEVFEQLKTQLGLFSDTLLCQQKAGSLLSYFSY